MNADQREQSSFPVLPADTQELQLGEIIATFWRERWRLVLAALAGLMLAFVLNAGWMLFPVGVTRHSIILEFPFPGADVGKYPSGAPFSINNIVSNHVLDDVSRRLEADDIVAGVSELADRISITPYTRSHESVRARYDELLKSRNLTVSEKERLEAQLKQELAQLTRRSAMLTLAVPDSSRWSAGTIERILMAIPDAWAKLSVESLGVLDVRTPGFSVGELEALESAKPLVKLLRMMEIVEGMTAVSEQLAKDPFAREVRDEHDNVRAADLLRQLGQFRRYTLLPLQQAVGGYETVENNGYYVDLLNAQIQRLELDREELYRKADVITESMSTYDPSDRRIARQVGSGSDMNSGEASVEYVDRMMAIGGELSEAGFRQELFKQRLAYLNAAEELTSRILQLQENLKLLESGRKTSYLPADTTESIAAAMVEMRILVARYKGLISSIRDARLGKAGQLYRLASSGVMHAGPRDNVLSRTLLFLLVGFLAGGFLGLCQIILRQVRA